mmetsp:Transcript_7565/g.18913  ORF Transcript_7565/g.18913 Transcript_7565/m.18913 type:complete len:264 (+) Transcript_7565:21-812(+)|eukprot:CAMPEP_0206228136 /NCGR_PEP_ID=MMETSP0047_2-20121206/9007_1 /ASSEMBLY_ACC=CAM_ASM_000192 /TAXON_ID=195065 /ORGANISM="Chroomonas mesostigmatica_cf, Strain CCMP1168" /LENGTH=263 /DNA_ID=CAMNT_0053651357 /DNA_START=153 /DNA_END=944 /DNA_ORIENTATION=-
MPFFDLLGLHLPCGGDVVDTGSSQLAHGQYYTNSDPSAWHKCDDPWGCYLKGDGNPATQMSNPQGHTQWTPVSWETWPNYNVTAGPYAHAEGHVTTTHLCACGDGDIVAPHGSTQLDGNGEYWDANIMERPDNTAGGTLWNPPDDEVSQWGGAISKTQGLSACACPSCTGSTQVTCAIAAITPVEHVQEQAQKVRPSPGHFLLAGHAMALGACMATINAGDRLLKGESKSLVDEWAADFKHNAEANAGAVTPLGQFVLQRHVL